MTVRPRFPSLRLPALRLAFGLALAAAPGCSDEGDDVGNVMVGVGYDALPDLRKASDAVLLPATDGGVADPDGGPAAAPCYAGTPTSQLQLLNACWAETTTAVEKPVMLPGGYKIGDPLPAIP
jgi:hypothetical protein